jgi:hypothetical protein
MNGMQRVYRVEGVLVEGNLDTFILFHVATKRKYTPVVR